MLELLEAIHEMVQNGLTWATVLSVVLFITKLREGRIRAKERAEMRQDIKEIKQVLKGESECAVTLNPTTEPLPRRGVVGCLCSWAASFSARCVNKFIPYRRRKNMKLNKFWAAGVLVFVVTTILKAKGIPIPVELDDSTMFQMAISLVQFLSGVLVALWNKFHPDKPVTVEQVIDETPRSYAEMYPIIKEVHDTLNKMSDDVRTGKPTQASLESMATYLKIKQMLDDLKKVS